MTAPTELSPNEVVARGKEIYEAKIRPLVEPEHIGEFLMVNIETGELIMGEDHAQTSFRARDKFPKAEIYGMRIGYMAAESMGGGMRLVNRAVS